MEENVEDLFYEGKNSQKATETEDDVAVKLTKLSRDALTQFFFGKKEIKDHIGKNEGFAYELREARRRLQAGKNPSEEPVFCKSLRIFKKGKKPVFCWNKIPGEDNDRLVEFLKGNYGIEWAEDAGIDAIEEGKTIQVCTENNSLFLVLNSTKTESILIIDDGRIDKLIADTENDELSIYESRNGKDELDENGTIKINGKLVDDIFEKKFKEMLERPEFRQKIQEMIKAGS